MSATGLWQTSYLLMLKMKCNFVIFRTYQKHIDYEFNIKIFDYNANSLVSLERKKMCQIPRCSS